MEWGGNHDLEYPYRIVRRGDRGSDWECRAKATMTKEGPEKSSEGEPLAANWAKSVRRGLPIVNYMAQDRPELAVTTRVLSQRMGARAEGDEL